MKGRPLFIDDQFLAECERLRDFAENPRNWYKLGEAKKLPGDEPQYVLETEFGFRVVFTITHAPEHRPKPFRHMTISIPGPNYPNPVTVFTVAHYLGFTGAKVKDHVVTAPGGQWAIGLNKDEHCIVVQEPYESVHA